MVSSEEIVDAELEELAGMAGMAGAETLALSQEEGLGLPLY
jgi:hypothetical protein